MAVARAREMGISRPGRFLGGMGHGLDATAVIHALKSLFACQAVANEP